MANIPKEVVSKTDISEDDDINIYAEDNISVKIKTHYLNFIISLVSHVIFNLASSPIKSFNLPS